MSRDARDFQMAKVVECKRCSLERWFSDNSAEPICPRCARNRSEKRKKIDQCAKRYRNSGDLRFAVIQCIYRHKLTVLETAQVLEVSERDVEFEIDIARQDAR